MRELTLHLLDIVNNSISARAQNITIEVLEDLVHDRLCISVEDDGCGMDEEMVRKVVDPFVTTRTTRKVGLGIPLFKAAAEACNGSFKIQSAPGKGTRVDAKFQHSHIDRMPLGDLPGTILPLVVGSSEVHWVFRYTFNDRTFEFDDAPIKEELDGIPLSEPDVLEFIRNYLQEGIESVRPAEKI